MVPCQTRHPLGSGVGPQKSVNIIHHRRAPKAVAQELCGCPGVLVTDLVMEMFQN